MHEKSSRFLSIDAGVQEVLLQATKLLSRTPGKKKRAAVLAVVEKAMLGQSALQNGRPKFQVSVKRHEPFQGKTQWLVVVTQKRDVWDGIIEL